MKQIVSVLLLLTALQLNAQTVYQHVSHTEIYDFLDELATHRIISVHAAVKPWSRRYIATKLNQAADSSSRLSPRQTKELGFYLRDYNKELLPDKNFRKRFDILYYRDSLFTFSLNPILGLQYFTNENGTNLHRWNGAEVFAYVGKHFGVYASLRDNYEEDPLSGYKFLNTRPGNVYKSITDYSEMRGGMTFTWNWGVLALVKDHVTWGTHHHYPSVLSAKAPSVTHLKLTLTPARWFTFNYIHGWLMSGVVDSLRSYPYTNPYGNGFRQVYKKKFIAANLFTFTPWRGLNASIGNSIVYSDYEAHPAYLIPFLLYKSVDHTLNNAAGNEGGQNSQFFIDISSHQINHVHLYATVFFDDVSISRLRQNGHMDYYSLNAGFRISNWMPNTFFTVEYFQSYPLVYKHNMPTTTYESNFYNLGHYLHDNSRGFFAELAFRPVRGLSLKASYAAAMHGRDHEALGTDRVEVVELFLDSITWKRNQVSVDASWQILNDVFVFAGYSWQHHRGEIEKYTAPFYRGKTNTFSFGVNMGF